MTEKTYSKAEVMNIVARFEELVTEAAARIVMDANSISINVPPHIEPAVRDVYLEGRADAAREIATNALVRAYDEAVGMLADE